MRLASAGELSALVKLANHIIVIIIVIIIIHHEIVNSIFFLFHLKKIILALILRLDAMKSVSEDIRHLASVNEISLA